MSVPLYVTVAKMRQTMTCAQVREALGLSRQQVSSATWNARRAGIVVRDGRGGGLVDDPEKRREIARLGGRASAAKRLTGRGWARSHGVMAGLGTYDTTGERCTCGLRVDKDHTPETCDQRGGASMLAEQRRSHWSDLRGEDTRWE